MKCLRTFKNVDSIAKAVATDTPTLSVLAREMGEEVLEGYLYLWIDDLNETVNVSKPLSEGQIEFTAFSIVNDFRSLTIADINLIFSKAKKGKYGEFYGSLSPDKILRWFDDYFSQRMEVCASLSYQKHQRTKDNSSDPRNSETTVKQYIKDIKK